MTPTADDLGPNVIQKGVDMRLGLDIAALTLTAHVVVIVLVVGDSEFVPAMKMRGERSSPRQTSVDEPLDTAA